MYNHPRVLALLALQKAGKRIIAERLESNKISLYFVDGDAEKGGTPWYPLQRLQVLDLWARAFGVRDKKIGSLDNRTYEIIGEQDEHSVMLDSVFAESCERLFSTIWASPQTKKAESKQFSTPEESFTLTFRHIP